MNMPGIALRRAAATFVLAGCALVLNSLIAEGAVPASAESLNWVRYTDSAEGAFSMEVPVGWQVNGGMYRFGYFDVRWMMDVRSLDGKVIVRIDDPNVPPYVLPGPHSGPAGHAAVKPGMFQMVVDDFREAGSYAESYARHRFGGVCTSMTPRTADWTPTLPESWGSQAGEKMSQASMAFDCATSDGPRIVNVYARTSIHGADGLWTVDPIISLIATPDGIHLAQAMTQRMISSWQVTPEWQRYQQKMTQMGLSAIREQFNQFMQQMQAYHQQREAAMNQQLARFESQQHAQASQASGWGETLTGLTTVRDSATGTEFQVFSGPKSNYYINGAGVKINSNINPGGGFRLMDVVSP